jgi:hypothetical protein
LRQFASVAEKSRRGTDENFCDLNAQEISRKKKDQAFTNKKAR